MRKILMLSARRDPDLVAIYNSIGKQAFIKLTKDALRSCIRPNYKICDQITIKNEIQNDKKIINVELSITSTNDTDICELLQNVKDRQANAFIRTCIRFYIGRVTILQTYLNNDFTALITAPQIIQVFGGFNLSSEAKPRMCLMKPDIILIKEIIKQVRDIFLLQGRNKKYQIGEYEV